MANNVLPTKQIPAAVEAEIAVIGSIFMEPSSLMVARDYVSSDDFYDIRNKLIYKTMIKNKFLKLKILNVIFS